MLRYTITITINQWRIYDEIYGGSDPPHLPH